VRAPFLAGVSDGQLQRMANCELERRHIDCDFGNSRVQGNRIYYDCGSTGRKCRAGRHHDHNRFYVEFTRAGDMMMHCYSKDCCDVDVKLGQWVSNVMQLLEADVWGPTRSVNPRLLDTLMELALDATTKGKTRDSKLRQMQDMPWWSQLEETVGAYISQYFKYVVRERLYIMQTLDHEGNVERFEAFKRGTITDTVRSYKWGFNIWDESSYKSEHATYARFCGEPYDEDVEEGEYNLARNAMPYLKLPIEQPTDEEIQQIQPLLEHIKESLCGGDEDDYHVFMSWIAHVAQKPNAKIGW
jgi:hypothetical protein